MTKDPIKSKTLVWASFLIFLGTLNAVFDAVDVTKLPPDVAKWLVPVIGLLTYLFRRFGSNLKAEPMSGDPPDISE